MPLNIHANLSQPALFGKLNPEQTALVTELNEKLIPALQTIFQALLDRLGLVAFSTIETHFLTPCLMSRTGQPSVAFMDKSQNDLLKFTMQAPIKKPKLTAMAFIHAYLDMLPEIFSSQKNPVVQGNYLIRFTALLDIKKSCPDTVSLAAFEIQAKLYELFKTGLTSTEIYFLLDIFKRPHFPVA